ncbi:MAG: ATP-grasp domain-containing protein [Alphaproteobacteria bacterium]|nr:ATP-grasp domain-containing protein [Alphaproteobacteria bacterium]MCB9700011.1 ATP-grasp domain-containing protein [Alphaproteobacteria bacterium]
MHVIFLEPAFPGNQREFVRALKAVGALVSGIGTAPLHAYDSELQSWLYSYEQVPSTASVEALTAATRNIQKRGPWVHKLESTVEALMLPAAETRERCGIPGLSVEQTTLVRDKYKMKQFLQARGIRCAQSAEVESLDEAKAFVGKVGFPIILKPLAAAGAAGTWRADDLNGLVSAARESGMGRGRPVMLEEFISGHEGFWDTLTCNGRVVYEQICHYYPNVLEAMRTRDCSPIVMITNRMDAPGYTDLKVFGRKVVSALGLVTTPTHMEWFYGPKGLFFSEIGARPPGVRVWDLYCAANEFDLYVEWAKAVVHGEADPRPSRRFSAGMVALRPNRDGRIVGYSGVEEIQRRYGDFIIRMHLPPAGSRTQPVESGYMGNAWVWARHPDYDLCKAMLEDIGRTIKVWAE